MGVSDVTAIVRSSFQSPEARRISYLPRAAPARAMPSSSVLSQLPIPAIPFRFLPAASTHATSAWLPMSTRAPATGAAARASRHADRHGRRAIDRHRDRRGLRGRLADDQARPGVGGPLEIDDPQHVPVLRGDAEA